MEIQQLQCPICMCLFSYPVTAYCGHTFCKHCLTNSLKTRRVCPMCRKQINHQPQKMVLDYQVNLVSQKLKTYKSRVQRLKYFKQKAKKLQDIHKQKHHTKQNSLQQQLHFLPKMTQMLLVDARCEEPLFPYNKGTITFQLQSPLLKNRLGNFVIRQEQPYRKFALIGSVVSLDYLRHNVYSCLVKIKAFCKIEDEWVQNSEQGGQQYYYRCCDVCQIAQDMSQISLINDKTIQLQRADSQKLNQLKENDQHQRKLIGRGQPVQILWQKFSFIFKKIQSKSLIKQIYNKVDRSNFMEKSDLVCLYYTMLGIINLPDHQKYKTATSFKTEKKLQQIDSFLRTFFNQSDYDKIAKEGKQQQQQKNNGLKLIRSPCDLINFKSKVRGLQIQALVLIIILALWFILGDGTKTQF